MTWILLVAGIAALIGVYGYLRIVVRRRPTPGKTAAGKRSLSMGAALVMISAIAGAFERALLAVPGGFLPFGVAVGIGFGLISYGLFQAWDEVVLDSWLHGASSTVFLLIAFSLWRRPSHSFLATEDSLVATIVGFGFFVTLRIVRTMPYRLATRIAFLAQELGWVLLMTVFMLQSVFDVDATWSLVPVALLLALLAFVWFAISAVRGSRRPPELREWEHRPAISTYAIAALAIVLALAAVASHLVVPVSLTIVAASIAIAIAVRQGLSVRVNQRLIEEANDRERYFRDLVQNTRDVIMIADLRGRLRYVSPAAEPGVHEPLPGDDSLARAIGVAGTALRGSVERLDTGQDDMVMLVGHRGETTLETSLSLSDGQLLASVRDVTERDMLRRNLHDLAHTDQLTGLPNRRSVMDRLAAELDERPDGLHLLFIDLDRFKQVNDVSGHSVGDAVLKQVAERLREQLPDDAVLGRLAGDEFVVLTRVPATEVGPLAARLVDSLRAPVEVSERSFQLGASIGVATSSRATSAEDLLRHADLAMYQAKRSHLSSVDFDATMAAEADDLVLKDLRVAEALRADRLVPHLQPQVDVLTGEVVAVESLLRWMDADGTLHGPKQLLDYVQRAGGIVSLSWDLFDRALAAVADQPQDVRIALNMPSRLVMDPATVEKVQHLCAHHGVDPSRLEFEITEDELLDSIPVAARLLRQLRDLGASIVIDDFGTGYSSLTYLAQLPVHGLKIDSTFIATITHNPAARLVLSGLVQATRDLGLRVVAEGVETSLQRDLVQAAGIQLAQGYWYARPEPAEAIVDISRLGSWSSSGGAQ